MGVGDEKCFGAIVRKRELFDFSKDGRILQLLVGCCVMVSIEIHTKNGKEGQGILC